MQKDRSALGLIAGLILIGLAVAVWLWPWRGGPVPVGQSASASTAREPELAGGGGEVPATRKLVPRPKAGEARTPISEHGPEELWGRVVTAAEGRPVANAEVELLQRDADEFWNLDLEYGKQITTLERTRSDADGRFAFSVARARVHRLRVRAVGFAPTTLLHLVGGSEVLVRLAPGAIVEGTVREQGTGRLLPGVSVRVVVRGESVELAAARTAADGSFRFADLQPARVFVQVRPVAWATPSWGSLQLVSGHLHRLEFELARGRTLRGRVTDAATERPIAGCELSDSWTFKRLVRSGSDGRYELHGFGVRGALFVRAAGYARQVRVVPSAAEQLDFALRRGGRLRGRFVDGQGTPHGDVYAAVGASFMVRPGVQDADWQRAEVGGDGRFEVSGLDSRLRYALYARGRGLGTRVYLLPAEVHEGEPFELGDIVLRPAGGLEGRLLDKEGQPGKPAGAMPGSRALRDDTRAAFPDLDASPTKAWLVTYRDDPQVAPWFHRFLGKRPAEELYDLATDPHEFVNVAGDPEHAAAKDRLALRLMKILEDSGEPRVCDVRYEKAPFTGPVPRRGKRRR